MSVIKDNICGMCENGCSIRVHVENEHIVNIEMTQPDVNGLCPRWKTQQDFIYHPDRLLYPLKRTGKRGEGIFTRISWDEALDITAKSLQDIKAKWGPESVIFYASFPKEPRPYFKRLSRVFGSPNYCSESSNCATSALLATSITYGREFGYLSDRKIDPASRCELVWSSGIRNSIPGSWIQYLNARPNGIKLIVVDPRRTKLAELADIHLQLRPGTDGALALGMLNIIIENGLFDRDFVDRWTTGFDELKLLTKEYTPEKVQEITGVSTDLLTQAAHTYSTCKPAHLKISVSATTHSSNGFQNHRAIIMLPALTGNIDIRGGNRGKSTGIPTNSITCEEFISHMPPGIGSDKFPLWTSFNGEMQSNVLSERIETAKPYPLKGLFAVGLNTSFFPNTERLTANLKKLDFIVVNEYFHNEGTYLADIVLPVASWLERPRLINNPLRLIEPPVEPLGESRPEWEIIAGLATRMGLDGEFWNGNFEACLNYILEPSGTSVARLRKNDDSTVKTKTTRRTERAYEKTGFKTPSGKVELKSTILEHYNYEPLPVYHEPSESPLSRPDLARKYPLVLTTGARSIVYTHSQFRQIKSLRKMVPEPFADINPRDAEIRGITNGDMVEVSTGRGSIYIKASVTNSLKEGVINIPHHWPGKQNVNILVDDVELDPISGFGSFKAQLCQVKKI